MMRKTTDTAVQKEICRRLTEAFRGDAMKVKVFDTPPGDMKMPYIVIGESSAVPFDTKNSPGEDSTCTIHFWSDTPGYEQVKAIKAKAIEALTESDFDLTAAGFEVLSGSLLVTQNTAFTDEDGKTKHAVATINIQIQQN